MQERTAPKRVKTPPVKSLVLVGLPFPRREIEVLPIAGRLVRLDARAADRFVDQQTAELQRRVADELRIQPPTALSGEPIVAWIGAFQLGSRHGAASVR